MAVGTHSEDTRKIPEFPRGADSYETRWTAEKHRTEGRISVQALAGRISFRTREQSIELSAGQMLTLEREIPHDVEAVTDSAFLLIIAWPGAPTASSTT
jgi:quercetin dioxygenase-like cupin family protein